MEYKKIIPCVTMENPIEEARFYNDAGADEVAFFDSNATEETFEKNLHTIKEIKRVIDIPLIACGGVRKLEHIKKLLYAGASKICMKSAPLADINIVTEAAERFGSERIICTIDLTECESPVEYARELKKAGAGELLLLHYNKLSDYANIVDRIRTEVGIPVIASSYDTEGEKIAKLLRDSNAESISLYNLSRHDIMEIKHDCINMNVPCKVFESSIDFKDFKLNSDGLIPAIVQDYKTGEVLMMAYMNEESYNETIRTGRMTYYSRSRKELWLKGLTSGHFQFVKSLSLDCDKDTILAKVSQVGAACHTGNRSCFFTPLVQKDFDDTDPLKAFKEVYESISDKKDNPGKGSSYTNYLFDKGLDKILGKVGEEFTNILIEAKNNDSEEMKYAVSDFMYHLMVLMVEKDLSWSDVIKELAERK